MSIRIGSAWDAEAEALVSDLAHFEGYHGRLGEGPPVLLDVFDAIEDTARSSAAIVRLLPRKSFGRFAGSTGS